MTKKNRMEQIPIEELVLQVQQGDEEKHHYLLKSYKPFMVKVVSEVCRRYIDPLRDDEFSIGLAAFNDAIFLYSPSKNRSFLSFAKIVVSRKVIDYIRSNSRRQHVVSFDYVFDEESSQNPAEVALVTERYQDEEHAFIRREETRDYISKLKEYNLSLMELTEVAPKHKNSRKNAIRIARLLVENEDMQQYVVKRKKLPLSKLQQYVNVSKKTLEKHRKYILAVFIVLNGDFDYLKEYLKEAGQ